MPLAIHLWPLVFILAVTRFLTDRNRLRSANKTASEKINDPDVEKEELLNFPIGT